MAPGRPNVYAIDAQDRGVLGMEGTVVAGQNDIWMVHAVSDDGHDAVVVNVAQGVVLIQATSDYDRGDAIGAVVGHAASSTDRSARLF